MLRINDTAPNFTAETSQGTIGLSGGATRPLCKDHRRRPDAKNRCPDQSHKYALYLRLYIQFRLYIRGDCTIVIDA